MQAATLNKDYQAAVAIGSLQGKDMLLRTTKRLGFEPDDVLDSVEVRLQHSRRMLRNLRACVMQAASLNQDYQTAVAIGSLQGKDMLLRITKRPGFELDDVLESDNDEKSESLWGRLTSWASKSNPLSEPALGAGEPLHHCPLTSITFLFLCPHFIASGYVQAIWCVFVITANGVGFSFL